MDIAVRPLTVELWPALSELFAVGGDSRWCWCSYWRVGRGGGGRSEGEQNRRLLRRLTERTVIAPGLLALEKGRGVGWVSVGPRDDYPRLQHSRLLKPVDDTAVWSIVCFVVAKPERGRGIARHLLKAAIAYARENGANVLEAYPVEADGERVPGSYAYLGTRRMYEQAGFRVVATRQATPNTRPRRMMRLDLGQ